MNNHSKVTKKFVILPVLLITGIVITSVFTTATGAVLQSVKSDISTLSTDTEQVQEELHTKTSLTNLSEKIAALGFSKSTVKYVKDTAGALASK